MGSCRPKLPASTIAAGSGTERTAGSHDREGRARLSALAAGGAQAGLSRLISFSSSALLPALPDPKPWPGENLFLSLRLDRLALLDAEKAFNKATKALPEYEAESQSGA